MVEESVTYRGKVKWFEPHRGFGFIVCESLEGDVLVHTSRLRPHGLRSVPPGTLIEFTVQSGDKGLQVAEVISVDFSEATPPPPPRAKGPQTTKLAHGPAGEFEPVVAKWFNVPRGYGFVQRGEEDVFVHAEALHACGLHHLDPGKPLEARVAHSVKGKIAVELRLPA